MSKRLSMPVSSDIRVVPAEDDGTSFTSMLSGGWQGLLNTLANTNPKYPPLEVLPCANISVDRYAVCGKPGKQACSACKLVSYCSKECQKAHWTTHKRDCKDAIRSSGWKPGWIVEGRDPSFFVKSNISPAQEFANLSQTNLSSGSSLWGNVPAMDIVNLPNNEKDLKTDLSLAFAASGDIRHIITTVNALGPDYSGKLNIVLNDLNPHIASRNIALLLILGTIPDEAIAADIALHFWYSVFMPMEYRFRILSMMTDFVKKGSTDTGAIIAPLGPHSTLSCLVSPDVQRLLRENAGPTMSPDEAQVEYKRIRTAPSRVDYHDRMYLGLKPSHRLSFLEYRRFGIILPFGALNAHCNVPNPSLFVNGVWLQTDYADPLESWDLDKVFHAGKVHGAQPEDVYGCLYFFLTDQLRTFARHIRQHHISFHVLNFEACALAGGIAQGMFGEHGIPATTRFNRIDVSNIMDANYAGIRNVIDAWEPLLAKNDHAALTGYFMNWVPLSQKESAADFNQSVFRNTLNLIRKKNRFRTHVDPTLDVFLAMDDLEAFNDTSDAFTKYWNKQGGTSVKLKLRTAHRIIPHRLKTHINAKPNALPEFADDETWYRHSRLTSRTWTERFVELSRRPKS